MVRDEAFTDAGERASDSGFAALNARPITFDENTLTYLARADQIIRGRSSKCVQGMNTSYNAYIQLGKA